MTLVCLGRSRVRLGENSSETCQIYADPRYGGQGVTIVENIEAYARLKAGLVPVIYDGKSAFRRGLSETFSQR
jgi:hypothetical protein